MKFKIHNRTWRVTQQGNGDNVFNDGEKSRLGLCSMLDRHIYLLDSQGKENMRDTLVHELTHAIIYEYALPQEMGEEQICDFMATYADDIISIADRYMKKYQKV